MKTASTMLKISALIPILGIITFLAQTQYQASIGLKYRVNIRGYDPRDLLRGRYLRYTFDLDTIDSSSSSITKWNSQYCFIRRSTTDYEIKQISKEQSTKECSSVLSATKLIRGQKYFIPESHAQQLETKLRDRTVKATVDLIINNNHHFTVGQLYFDGKPWEEVINH